MPQEHPLGNISRNDVDELLGVFLFIYLFIFVVGRELREWREKE